MCNPALNDLGLTDEKHVCNCGADGHADQSSEAHGGADAVREHYLVNGMTCDHCVASVTEELSAVDGVERLDGYFARYLPQVYLNGFVGSRLVRVRAP